MWDHTLFPGRLSGEADLYVPSPSKQQIPVKLCFGIPRLFFFFKTFSTKSNIFSGFETCTLNSSTLLFIFIFFFFSWSVQTLVQIPQQGTGAIKKARETKSTVNRKTQITWHQEKQLETKSPILPTHSFNDFINNWTGHVPSPPSPLSSQTMLVGC